MELEFNGHACVTLRAGDGVVVVTDPYEPGAFGGLIGHAPVRDRADVVTVSHYHADHAFVTSALGTPTVVDRTGAACGVAFVARPTYHDRVGGARMGMTSLIAFTLDGLRIAHLGDIGCPLSPADVAALGPVDVLLWPVGGRFTLGPEDAPAVLASLRPRLAIPLHYKNRGCTLDIAPIEALAPQLATEPARPGASGWSSADGLPAEPTVLVLEPRL